MTTTQSRPVNNLTRWDLGRVNTLSRWYTTGKNAQESIDEIAEALELAQSPEEEHSILWWWNEGCRDYATDMVHLDELNAALPARRAELFPKG